MELEKPYIVPRILLIFQMKNKIRTVVWIEKSFVFSSEGSFILYQLNSLHWIIWNTKFHSISFQIVHYTPKAAIFDFYSDVKMVVEPNGHEVVIGKCGTCSQTIRGSRNVTSNFVTHVKVRDEMCEIYLN